MLLHAHVAHLHLAFSVLMFHLPSLLFPDIHWVKRTSARVPLNLAIWPKSSLHTGYEPKKFDKITSVDGDTTPINDSREHWTVRCSHSVWNLCFARFSW